MSNIDIKLKESLGDSGYRQFKQIANQAIELRQLQGMISYKEMIALKAQVAEVDKIKLYVGIPQETSSRGNQDGGITNAELLYIHTNGTSKKAAREEIERRRRKAFSGSYGTVRQEVYQMFLMEHGSPAQQIPPRPVIEPAILTVKNETSKHMISALTSYIAGDLDAVKRELHSTGLIAQSACQKWFEDPRNNWPPLAKSTIEAKKKKHDPDYEPIPLVDTGALRQAITYVFDVPKSVIKKGEQRRVIK